MVETDTFNPYVRFSEYFKLGKNQQELDFVDVPIDTDVLLYVDPYSFKINNGEWYIECNNLVVDFFQHLIDAIRDDDASRAKGLLHVLSEPNRTHLGHSSGKPSGRGMGPLQAEALYKQLSRSKAVQSGLLCDLCECELMIEGVGNDRISDITTNVVNMKLIEFTQQQCAKWSIPTEEVQSGVWWCSTEGYWKNSLVHLPVCKDQPVLLVPKNVVRRKMSMNHDDYWRNYLMRHLQMEHLNLNSSLCRVVKRGKRTEIKEPTKESLKPELPCKKEKSSEYTMRHPDILQRYKYDVGQRQPLPSREIDQVIQDAIKSSDGISSVVVVNNSGDTFVNSNNTHVNGDNIGGVIGSGTVSARDIKVFKDSLGVDSQLKKTEMEILVNALEAVNSSGMSEDSKNMVAGDISILTKELAKDEKDSGRISSVIQRIGVLAPPVVDILKGVEIVADLLGY